MRALSNDFRLYFNENLPKGGYITEKFALLNLLRALGGLAANGDATEKAESADTAATTEPTAAPDPTDAGQKHNFMAEVLSRHERISNRLKK